MLTTAELSPRKTSQKFPQEKLEESEQSGQHDWERLN